MDIKTFIDKKIGFMLMPLFANSIYHYVVIGVPHIGKQLNDFIIFNLIDELVNREITLLPMSEIRLWHLEHGKGLNKMRSAAWSSDCDWFFFFTPDREVFLCHSRMNYALCVNDMFFVPFLDMFVEGCLQSELIRRIELAESNDVQLSMF